MAPHPITEGSKNSDAGVAGALLTRLDPATCSPLARDAATRSTAAQNRIVCVPSSGLPSESNAAPSRQGVCGEADRRRLRSGGERVIGDNPPPWRSVKEYRRPHWVPAWLANRLTACLSLERSAGRARADVAPAPALSAVDRPAPTGRSHLRRAAGRRRHPLTPGKRKG